MANFKKVLSFILTIAITASLFANCQMPVFAEGETVDRQEITLDFVPNDVVVNSTTASEKYAVINDTTIRVYKSPDYKSEGVELKVNAGTVIELVTAYTYSDGQVVYRFDYYGVENSALYSAALSELGGYPIIPAKYITVGVETVENTTITDPDTAVSVTGVLPTTAELDTVPTTTSELPEGTDTSAINENALFYDFTLSNGGAVFEPSSTVKVTFPEANINFVQGTEYTIYHVSDDGVVTVLSTEVYEGGDINVNVDGFSYIGLSADVDFETVPTFKAQFAVNPVKLYADTALSNSKEFVTTSSDIFTISMKAIITDGDKVVEVYVIDENSYEGTNTELSEAITPSDMSAPRYTYVMIGDVKEYDDLVMEDTVLEDESTGITVSGSMPSGTALTIREKDVTDISINDEIYLLGEKTKVYDVSLKKDGQDIMPNGELTVNIPEDELGFDLMTGYFLYQVYEDGTVKVEGPFVYSGGDINLSIDDASCLIYTDPFVEATTINWTRYFNKNSVTLYDSPLSIANEYILKNATEQVFVAEYYFVDKNENTWYMVYNNLAPEFDVEYIFIKEEDTSKTKVEIPTITITDETNNTGISLVGKLPEGTTATIERVTDTDGIIDTSVYPLGNNPVIMDITLYDKDGKEYQPDSSVDVVFPAELFESNEGKFYIGYHVHNGEVEVLGPFEYTGEDIYVTVDSFSYIIIGDGYTQEEINPPYEAVFTGDTVTLFKDHLSTEITEDNSVTINVTEKDIVEVYIAYNFDDGTVKYALDYKLTEGDENFNADLYDAISDFSTPIKNIVLSDSIKKYVKPEQQTLKDLATGITIDGMFPTGTTVKVEKIAKENISLDTSKYPLGANVSAFNITLMYEGEEYQPEREVTINLPKKNIDFNLMSAYMLYHTHGNSTSAIGPFVYTGDDINLKIEGFSQFVFTDTYVEATTINQAFYFTNKLAKLYDSPLPYAAEYTSAEGLEGDFIAEAYYVEANGTKWYAFYNSMFADFDAEYIYVKEADVSFDDRVVDFDKVAPIWMGSPSEYTVAKARTIRTFLNGPATNAEEPDNGLELDKYISEDGKNIVLEVYTTGSKTITSTNTQVPTDIVLVLDQSGSMSNNMTSTEYIAISGTAKEAHAYAKAMGTLYARVGDEYKEVDITANGATSNTKIYLPWSSRSGYTGTNEYFHNNNRDSNLYYNDGTGWWPVNVDEDITSSGGWWPTYTYTYKYTYIKDNNQTVTLGENITGQSTVPSFASKLHYSSTQSTNANYVFSYVDENSTTVNDAYAGTDTVEEGRYYYSLSTTMSRLAALKKGVTTFADSVAEKANPDGVYDSGDEINHRIAVIGFSGKEENSYSNTELFIGAQQINYKNVNESYNKQAFQNMNTKDGQDNIAASIGALVADGSTYVHRGMDLANGVLDDNPLATGENRNRVIVVFTDGVPGYSTSWSNDSKSTGEAAIEQANIAKANGVTVYAVGIFDNADPSIAGSWNDNAEVKLKANYYMQNMSSNNGTPQTPSYYLAANDGGTLNNIFKTIAGNIESGGSSTTLDEETVVKDIVSPHFKLPDDVTTDSIKIYTAAVKSKSGNEYTWNDPVEFTDGVATITALLDENGNVINDEDGNPVMKTINVTNYDFSENWVGAVVNNGVTSYHGSKLIIEIPFEVEPLFLGGNDVLTNGPNAGVYKDSLAKDAIEEFVSPDVDVEVKKINPVTKDQNIYLTNTGDVRELITEFYVYGQENESLDKFINGVNNAYVDITYTITYEDKDNNTVTVGTLIIPKGEKFVDAVKVDANWKLADATTWTPYLENDQTYKISCIVDGGGKIVIDGKEVNNNKTGTGNAEIKVFTPVVTLNDTTTYYGSNVNIMDNIDEGVDYVEWENGSTSSDDVTMRGKEPTFAGMDYDTVGMTEADVLPGQNSNKSVNTPDDIPVDITAILFNGEQKKDIIGDVRLIKDIDCAKSNEVDFIIHVKSAELTITKNVDDSAIQTDAFDSQRDTFTFKASLPGIKKGDKVAYTVGGAAMEVIAGDSGIVTITLKDGQSAVFNKLPIGNYNVVEEEHSAYTTTVSGNASGTFEANPDKLKATITFKNIAKSTSLEVSKTVVAPAYVLDKNETFSFYVTLSGVMKNKLLVYKLKDANDQIVEKTVVIDDQGRAVITLKHNEKAVFEKLPVGATYSVKESMTDEQKIVYECTVINSNDTNKLIESKTSVDFKNSRQLANLTITKEAGINTTFEAGETFIFKVYGPNKFYMEVVIKGTDSITLKDLPLGTYTVKEDTDWSPNYDVNKVEQSATLAASQNGAVTFTNTKKTDQWLKSYAYAENKFADATKGGSVTTVKKPNIADN